MKVVNRVAPGTFLVASPVLRDPNFVHTVVLMCDHTDEGSWGLVVNRRTGLTFGDLIDDLPFPASSGGPVYWGGPCETTRLQVLHRLRQDIASSVEVCPGLDLGLDPPAFRSVLSEQLLPGESLQAYVGHAGWGAGQLEQELGAGSWVVCTAEARVVFDVPADEMWEHVLQSLGPEFGGLTRVPVDPRVN